MDRKKQKDGWMHRKDRQMVGWTGKKGWLEGYKKDGWLAGWLVGWIEKIDGWLEDIT